MTNATPDLVLAAWKKYGDAREIVGAENVRFPNKAHTEVTTSRAAFVEVYEFLTGERRTFEEEVQQEQADLRWQDLEAGLAEFATADVKVKRVHPACRGVDVVHRLVIRRPGKPVGDARVLHYPLDVPRGIDPIQAAASLRLTERHRPGP